MSCWDRIPEQTTPDQAREEFEDQAAKELADLTASFESGMEDRRITVAAEAAVSIDDAIERILANNELVVLGEDDPSLLDFLWRPTAEEVAERTLAPVLVAQRAFDEA
ncbi:MAG: hypothetical protein V5A56_00850 [Halolamina sp.]